MDGAHGIKLYGYQQEDVDKLAGVPAGLDASEMGTGKTYKGIAVDLTHRTDSKLAKLPTLVVGPLSTLDMWKGKYNELAPDLKTYRVNATSKKTREWLYQADADVYIVHWEGLRLLPGLAQRRWGLVIADECHRAQNRKAQQTTALKRIKTIHKLGLSGTPVTTRPEKFCSILNWLYPKDKQFSSYWRFFYRIAVTHQEHGPNGPYDVIDGYRDDEMEAVLEYISPYYIRHLKKEQCCPHHPQGVLPELPDKYYLDPPLTVSLTPQQQRAYNEMKKDMLAWVGKNEDQPVVAAQAVSKLMRLQQFASGYATVVAGNQVRLTEPSSKLDAVMELLEDHTEQVVIFSQFRQLIDLLHARLVAKGIPHVTLTGDTNQGIRGKLIEDFQSGRARVFCGTIGAGGVGITLTAASTVVMLDRAWSPALNQQAEDRLHRPGQKNAVQVIDVVAKGTVDIERGRKIDLTWGWLKKLLGDT